jgi:hypothetical protein
MFLQELGFGGMDWIELVKDMYNWRVLAKEVMDFRVLFYAGNFLIGWKKYSFSR